MLLKLGLSDHSFYTVKLFLPCADVNAFFRDNRFRSKERSTPYLTPKSTQALFSFFLQFF